MALWVVTTLLDWRFYLTLIPAYVVTFYVRVLFNGMPPGPRPLPLFGNLLQYSKYGPDIHLAFCDVAKTYRDVFTFYLGYRPIVVLASYDAVREAFVKHGETTSSRPDMFTMTYIGVENKGLVQTRGSMWREHRQFATRVLRDLGMGKSVLEERIQEEATALCDIMRSEQGQAFDPQIYLGPAVSNIICALVYGRRFSYTDPSFVAILYKLDEITRNFSKVALLNQYPWIRFIPGDVVKFKNFTGNWAHIMDWINKDIAEHDLKSGSQDDYMSYFLNEQAKKNENKLEENTFTDSQLCVAAGDLLLAGTETTTTLLRWCIVFMLRHPECLLRLQQEVDDVIGQHRAPSMKDKTAMPYTQAFLCEVHRRSSIAAVGVPHKSTSDVTVCGHKIPAGTWIIANLYAIHHDPENWHQPMEFKPERFLDDSGELVRAEKLLPFGTGPRACLGEPLARMEQFIFLTSLIQSFTFHPPPGASPPSTTSCQSGIALGPLPYTVTLRDRRAL